VLSAMIGGDTCTGPWLSDQLANASIESADTHVLRSPRVLVLDCRSADEYSLSHVSGSLSVIVPSIMLRRLRNGSTNVAAVISDHSARALFTDHCRKSHIVLYDASGASGDALISRDGDVNDIGGDGVVPVLMNRLKSDGCRVSYLLGRPVLRVDCLIGCIALAEIEFFWS